MCNLTTCVRRFADFLFFWSGLGWKAKLVVGWALDREVADGLEIVDKLGNHYVVTAMVLRDELFNRLIAMGGQKWEAW